MHYRDRYFLNTKGRSIRGKKGLQYRCVGCKKWFPKDKITVDHIIPMRLGGINCIGNLQGMCRSCNSSKGPRVTRHDYFLAFRRCAVEFKLIRLLASMLKRKILDILGVPYQRET